MKKRRASLLSATGEPDELRPLMAQHLEWMRVRNYSEASVQSREKSLLNFALWCEERELTRPASVTKPLLERYQRHLFLYRKKDGKPLGVSTQHQRLVALQVFFRWLARNNLVLSNPAADLELPRPERRLPHILTAAEVARILAVPDVSTPDGLRDRAMVEVLWATGIRRMELAALTLSSIDADRGTLMVRRGKGKKDRLVPIAPRAVAWVDSWLATARPALLVPPDSGALFLTNSGQAFNVEHLSMVVRRLLDAADLKKPGACHLFRHSMATAMLEAGADVRFIQQLLGHSNLNSTALYTQVSIRKLLEVYAQTHPAVTAGAAPKPQLDAAAEPPATPEALLAVLAAEADEEDAGDDAE